ncbi:hypothetical protein MCJ35_31005 [Enterocloster sp. OA13]|uniref:Uncharacterized protein n=1 Tax=Enterocloster hominis (ex Hitch et al. 2024) TaxID=1917870 RepID=A0ABV1D903_9FIRM|nr:hypothetical protein [Lachnoclostridium pacaense]MCC2820689.1 hypothetical protein [Lachnoclostridium pacaense]MCC2879912.1 hypothetical protein [Lachnoclostridium pacaense]MCD8171226.1 hypothetical protein [Clostridiales bacterium]MCH1953621.1 hypothetical protein [Enterocloster sp. OA13]
MNRHIIAAILLIAILSGALLLAFDLGHTMLPSTRRKQWWRYCCSPLPGKCGCFGR